VHFVTKFQLSVTILNVILVLVFHFYFFWSPFEDASGNVVSGEGEAADAGCNTIISGEVEYVGTDATGPDYSGTGVGANHGY